MLRHLALGLVLTIGASARATNDHHGHTGKTVEVANRVKYHGTYKDDVEAFLGIKYAHDTSGINRFEPPKPYTPTPGSSVQAVNPGPACPQDANVGESFLPLYLTIFRDYSEDCLSLNVNRPNGTQKDDRLPVMVFIHGT